MFVQLKILVSFDFFWPKKKPPNKTKDSLSIKRLGEDQHKPDTQTLPFTIRKDRTLTSRLGFDLAETVDTFQMIICLK